MEKKRPSNINPSAQDTDMTLNEIYEAETGNQNDYSTETLEKLEVSEELEPKIKKKSPK